MATWTTDCGCTEIAVMGKKRRRLCDHGHVFKRVKEDGSKATGLRAGKGFQASAAQRAKVKGMPCAACGREATESGTIAIDPAHVWPQGKGGCNDPDCVIPLCRVVANGEGCHRLFDEGRLELLERFADSEAWQAEQAHPILKHGVSPVELVRRLGGGSYEFVKTNPHTKGPVPAAPEGAR